MTDPYLDRLKRDRGTTWTLSAAIFGIVPMMVGIVAILLPGPHIDLQVNPLYWIILLIPMPWCWRLMDYEPRVLRTVRPMLWATPILACMVTGVAWAMNIDMVPYWWMIVATLVTSAVGLIAYPHSMLAKEPPPR